MVCLTISIYGVNLTGISLLYSVLDNADILCKLTGIPLLYGVLDNVDILCKLTGISLLYGVFDKVDIWCKFDLSISALWCA